MSTKRQRILAKTNGLCIYCGGALPAKGWHADHFVPILRGLEWDGNGGLRTTGDCSRPEYDTEANLVPACASCNIDKGSLPIWYWRRQIARTTSTLRKQRAYKFAFRFGLVQETGSPVLFWFETEEAWYALPDSVREMIASVMASDPFADPIPQQAEMAL